MEVWIEEEHGYADYIWQAPFTTDTELYGWWENFDKTKIPDLVFGSAARMPDEKSEQLLHCDEVELTVLIKQREEQYEKVLGGKIRLVAHSQMAISEEEWDIAHDELKACNYYFHVHEEEDSFLSTVVDDKSIVN